MGSITEKKICIDCKMEYKPTSNVQKRCPECRATKQATTSLHRNNRKSPEKCINKACQNGNKELIQRLMRQREDIDTTIRVLQEMA